MVRVLITQMSNGQRRKKQKLGPFQRKGAATEAPADEEKTIHYNISSERPPTS
jgi:hypothetical protein